MSFNPLSLSHPDSPVGVVDLTHSPIGSPPDYIPVSPFGPPPGYIPRSPVGPPPGYIPRSPVGPPPDYIPVSPFGPPPGYIPVPPPPEQASVRRPRRCSCCRQIGHDVRNCPDAYAVHYRGQTYNLYQNPRENLTQFVYSRILQRAPQFNGLPRLLESLFEDILFHVEDLSFRELKTALKNPLPILTFAYNQLILRLENLMIARASRQPAASLLGTDYAKNIAIDLTASETDASECFICCDNTCSVETSCGHNFCIDCVIKIVYVNKDKTKAPLCSFCKTPFVKFVVSETSHHARLCEFIKKLN